MTTRSSCYSTSWTSTPAKLEPTLSHVTESAVCPVVAAAWDAFGDPRQVAKILEIGVMVSTNAVYRIVLEDGDEVIAKRSSYGSFVHFRQDHIRIHEWIHRLRSTRYASFLAGVLQKDGEVFTYRDGTQWVVFYEKTKFYDFLPKVLTVAQIESFGEEMALFHRACLEISNRVHPTWQTLGSDIATLHDVVGREQWRKQHGFLDSAKDYLRAHCDAFLNNADQLGYHEWARIPVLIDWNTGNFSVGMDGDGFKFFSRWDYDWFRIEPRMMDFYFAARVVREEGDQTAFSYTVDPLFDPRFEIFLRAYHQVHRLTENEVLFLEEAYRFFILNYVIRVGEHFFQPQLCKRLQREAIDEYLPALMHSRFEPLLEIL